MIVTPVNWYQVTSPLKLMMDRVVYADGGNPDPTLTHGKKAKKAKEVELSGLGLSPSTWKAASSPSWSTATSKGARTSAAASRDWLRVHGPWGPPG